MKKIFLISEIIALIFLICSCKKKLSGEVPLVTTDDITDIKITSALCWSTIVSDGGSEIKARGVCWGTEDDPTISNESTIQYEYPPETIYSPISSLIPDTKYFLRAYATNSSGTGYGESKSFITVSPKASATTLASSNSLTSATVGGKIAADYSGTLITERGIIWGTNKTLTSSDNKIECGSGLGIFSTVISGLVANTTYYAMAYCITGGGTDYGEVVDFASYGSSSIQDIDGNYYNTVMIGSQDWMKENLRVTRFNDGSLINKITDPAFWFTTYSTPAYVENSDTYYSDFRTNYGNYYDLYAVIDSRNLCPEGWHIPSDDDWFMLESYLGGSAVAGGKLKSTVGWYENTTATNESGFTAYPDVCFVSSGGVGSGAVTYPPVQFFNKQEHAYWWSTSGNSRRLEYYSSVFLTNGEAKNPVYSVRCVKN